MFRRIAMVVFMALVLLVLVLLVRTFANTSRQVPAEAFTPMAIDRDAAAQHLSAAITHKTISFQIPWEVRGDEFKQFHAFLAETYPKTHTALKREVIAENALLYTWEGSDPAEAPIILLAHMDVVPVDKASEANWTHPPFAGEIADGFVWGRGALDDKNSMISIFEAAEALIGVGFKPKRTVYLAFGHDEEIGGQAGAAGIAAALKERGVMAEFTLDEGSAFTQGIVPGVAGPLALIGLGEKGYLTLELSVKGEGGHSSQPPAHTSIGVLSRAIVNIENQPLKPHLDGPMLDMLEIAGPEMTFPMRLVMSNLWLFKPLIMGQFEGSKATAAALRTTTAVTMINAGTKENVLPIDAKAVVNFRILQGDTVASITEHITKVVSDPNVTIKPAENQEATEASPLSSRDSAGYQAIARTARQVLPACAVAPGLVLGATDSKRYYEVSKDQYRFQPTVITGEDLKTIHGTNEKLSMENLERMIQFYAQLLKNVAG